MGKRRVKYSPEEVTLLILNKPLYYAVAKALFTADRPLHASEISRIIKKSTGEDVSPGYVYVILQKLEKWGVAEPVKDPLNGRLTFKPSNKKVARLLREEIMKREAREIEELIKVSEE